MTSYSRLYYVLTNASSNLLTEFSEEISDHIFFNASIQLTQSDVRRVPSVGKKEILREITSLVEEDISSILSFLRNNLNSYIKKRIPKFFAPDPLEFKVPNDAQRLLEDWTKDYLNFAKSACQLRFSSFQGLDFKILRRVTKYDQFYKRDGSIISVLKDQSGNTITNPVLVSKCIVDHLQSEDNKFQGRTYIDWTKPPALLRPSDEQIRKFLKKVSLHEALTSFPMLDEFVNIFWTMIVIPT